MRDPETKGAAAMVECVMFSKSSDAITVESLQNRALVRAGLRLRPRLR